MNIMDDFAGDSSTTGVLDLDGTTSGSIETNGDTDWFLIAPTDGEILRIASDSEDDPALNLVDEFGNIVATGDYDFNANEWVIHVRVDEGETFYLEAAGVYGTSNYTLTTSVFTDDYHDTADTTGILDIDGDTVSGEFDYFGIPGNVSEDDVDWFAIELTAGHIFEVITNNHDVGMNLVNEDGDVLSFGTFDSGEKVLTIEVPVSGTYYIEVINTSGIDDCRVYDLTATLLDDGADDVLVGGFGADMLFGRRGDDILEGLGGADTLDGGDGVDTASYESSTNGVLINMATNTAESGHAIGDTFVSIENLIGSQFGDVLTGSGGDNVISGGAGIDVVSGFHGDDVLDGGAGRDYLTGGSGADTIDGGDGIDMARYIGSNAGVIVDLGAGTASGGHAQGDMLSNVEQLFGSSHADTLTGDAQNNFILGSGGDDILDGAGGIDKLFGGTGADTFVFGAGDDFTFVTDWEDDIDSLDLSQYGFATIEDAMANMNQYGSHVRFFVDGETLLILNADLADMADDIIIDDAMI